MSQESFSESQKTEPATASLKDLAALLRQSDHLDPEAQKSLASLLEELSAELDSSDPASAKTAHLATTINAVARSLHGRDSAESLESARDRLKDAAVHAETEAPAATGLAYRLIDLLGSIGI